jgi:methyl-accepting chemotaxis protein
MRRGRKAAGTITVYRDALGKVHISNKEVTDSSKQAQEATAQLGGGFGEVGGSAKEAADQTAELARQLALIKEMMAHIKSEIPSTAAALRDLGKAAGEASGSGDVNPYVNTSEAP